MQALRDSENNLCYSYADACKMAALLADDPTQPFVFSSSCSYRTELMIGRLVTEYDISAPTLGRAYIFAQESSDDVMHAKQQPLGPLALNDLKNADAENTFSKLTEAGVEVKIFNNQHAAVQGKNLEGWHHDGEYIGFTLGFGDAPNKWDGHVSLSIRVMDEDGKGSRFMVIDPHLEKQAKPLSFDEWKTLQNCDAAALFVIPVGQKAQRIGTENDHIARDFDDTPCRLSAKKFPEMAPDIQSSKFSKNVTGDWDSMTPTMQRDLTQRWEQELKPLRLFQDWCMTQVQKITAKPAPKISPGSPRVSSSL